ncbi:hypothetical protein [Candidatus Uabimicrobium sp. HlEnr_7]|uniref:hypothetical protein n=1 Tax=Candidatus Uabimicrobium helgolandensis TaxID=3095367 RepID=UPI00355814B2
MANWKELATKLILVDREIDARETRLIKEMILEDSVIDEEELEFLIHLRNTAKTKHQKFEQFFFKSLRKFMLKDGNITSKKAQKIHEIITVDEKIGRRERKFVRELRVDAKKCSKKYDELFVDILQIN